MALQMSNATNAVSNKGVNDIITKLQSQIDGILKVVEGQEYNDFMTTIENNCSHKIIYHRPFYFLLSYLSN